MKHRYTVAHYFVNAGKLQRFAIRDSLTKRYVQDGIMSQAVALGIARRLNSRPEKRWKPDST